MEPFDRPRVTVEVHLEDLDPALERVALRSALAGRPRTLPPRYFYDETGSALFEEITEQPEYYLTRTESALLHDVARRIADRAAATSLVELGSGAAVKTRILLDAMNAVGTLERYVPFDVDEQLVRRVADELTAHYQGLVIHGVVGDFAHHLERIPPERRRLVAFLGSTLGNFDREETIDFLTRLADAMTRRDHFLLGFDRIKDRERLEAAYNDAAGVTERFNRNILAVVNERFGGDFDPGAFRHRAVYDAEQHRIEMRLVAERRQRIRLEALDLAFELDRGEEILTEISTKYDHETIEQLLAASGLEPVEWYTDREELFSLVLARLAEPQGDEAAN